MAAGEDVGSCRRVVLDHRAKETVERVVGDEQVLKLIQTHDRHPAVGLMEAQRYVEKFEQRPRASSAPGRAALGAIDNCTPASFAVKPSRAAQRRTLLRGSLGSTLKLSATRAATSPTFATFDRSMPDGSHRGDMGVEKAGLAKAPRGRESDRHAISGRALERIELEPPIYERVRLNGPLVAERVHRTSLYGLSGQP